MTRCKTVLFDLDGTLIDSIRLILDSFHHTFAAFGLPARSDEAWLSTVGTPLSAQFAPWAPDDATLTALIDTYRTFNLAHHDDRVTAYPGIVDAARELHARGVRLGLVTSKARHSAERGLRIAGLLDIVDVTVCAEDVVNPKPHREPVDRALAMLGAERETSLFVGDSVHDLHAGRGAAVATGAALWGPFAEAELARGEPTHWLRAPEDLVRVVLEWA